jgi:ATP-binding cassette subfamily F protein 3
LRLPWRPTLPATESNPPSARGAGSHLEARAAIGDAQAVATPVPQLAARGLAKSFGGRSILRGADLDVEAGARIGMLGPNGGGKSTLLRILAGLDEPDAGTVTRRRGLVLAHLPQIVAGDGRDARATVLGARPELAALEAELLAAEARLADPALAADLGAMGRALAHHERLLARWTEAGGDRADGEALGHLRALGLDGAALELPTRELSGGQRKLVALAACLVRRPDVLLIDEPEAHLDMSRRELLGELLDGFDGAVVMVSHDRHLLDATVGEIAELDRGTVRMWPGAYSAYVMARQLELQRQQQQWVTQRKEIERLEEAVRRFRHWAHITVNERAAKQARVKQMQIDRMDKIERPVLERRKMALALRSGARGGQRVLALEGVDAGFGDDPVLLDVDLVVGRGERVGVVGPNGGGKTTLLRILAADLEPLQGTRWAGDGIAVGYLSQAAGDLPDELSVIDALRVGRSLAEDAAVRLLMAFLFDYEQCRRPVATLSGGERTRLAFLCLMQDAPNCLVLDEPTNHLDIDSIEALEDALERYDGTVVAVSHDRYFLDRIADRIVLVADGEVRAFEGGWSANAELVRATV